MKNSWKHAAAERDDTLLLVAALPAELQNALHRLSLDQLIEVVMDLGRFPEARLRDRVVRLSERPVTQEELAHVTMHVGEFGDDNRAGIERSLHRISAMRNRKGQIVGLTLRVGRGVILNLWGCRLTLAAVGCVQQVSEQARIVVIHKYRKAPP